MHIVGYLSYLIIFFCTEVFYTKWTNLTLETMHKVGNENDHLFGVQEGNNTISLTRLVVYYRQSGDILHSSVVFRIQETAYFMFTHKL